MATTIEKEERDIQNTTARLYHVQALIDALGNPSEWEYKGEMVDHDKNRTKCSCGHPIRYEFILHHANGRTAPIGSTCVDHYAVIRPEDAAAMQETLKKHMEKLAASKKEAKKLLQDAEIQDLVEEAGALKKEIWAMFASWGEGYLEYSKWNLKRSYLHHRDLKPYKQHKALKEALLYQIERFGVILKEGRKNIA